MNQFDAVGRFVCAHKIKVLFRASRNGLVVTVRRLIRCCDVNAPNSIGETPLHMACLSGHKPTITLLLDSGACPLKENASGVFPWWYTGSHEIGCLLQRYRVCKICNKSNVGNSYVMEPGYHPKCLPDECLRDYRLDGCSAHFREWFRQKFETA